MENMDEATIFSLVVLETAGSKFTQTQQGQKKVFF